MNTDELEAVLYWAERRVLEIQAKLHRWAIGDHERRFDDLFNLAGVRLHQRYQILVEIGYVGRYRSVLTYRRIRHG